MYVLGWGRLVYAGGRLECVRVGGRGSRLGCVFREWKRLVYA